MKKEKKSDLATLLGYAGGHKGLTFLGLALSAVSMLLSMVPYICIWLVARDLIAVAPNWTQAQNVTPVSYTHLDVYKRQGKTCPTKRQFFCKLIGSCIAISRCKR